MQATMFRPHQSPPEASAIFLFYVVALILEGIFTLKFYFVFPAFKKLFD